MCKISLSDSHKRRGLWPGKEKSVDELEPACNGMIIFQRCKRRSFSTRLTCIYSSKRVYEDAGSPSRMFTKGQGHAGVPAPLLGLRDYACSANIISLEGVTKSFYLDRELSATCTRH